MSFREKSAWVSFLLVLGVFVPFFWNSYRQFTGERPAREAFATAIWLLAAFVVLEIGLHVVLAVRAPAEARSARDEREQLIDLQATRAAFYVLLTGAFAAVGMVHLSRSPWVIQQAVLLAIVVSQLVRFGGQIVRFRRDA